MIPLHEDVELDELDELAVDEDAELGEGASAGDESVALEGPLEPEPEGLSTAQKVGVGAGVTGLVGLLGFGIYKVGTRLGWWGRSVIIIDDPAKPSDTPTKKDSTKPSGGGGSRIRAIGKPPNISGDPEGYNTARFPGPGPVRLTMNVLGYKVAYNGETLVPNNQPNPTVRSFQKDWNAVIKGLDAGRVKFPTVDEPTMLKQFRGLLVEDGIPGKNTLNALEITFNNWLRNALKFKSLVEQA